MLHWLKNRVKTIYQQLVLPEPPPRDPDKEPWVPPGEVQPQHINWKEEFAQQKRAADPHWEEYQAWNKLVQELTSPNFTGWLEYGRSLTLSTLRIRSLPARFKVGGNLLLRQCQRLRTIGDHLEVKGDLEIGGRCSHTWWGRRAAHDPACPLAHRLSQDPQCPLEKLPENLIVLGSCRLTSCYNLTSLPEKFVIEGDLTIESCQRFSSLPSHLTVQGDLNLIGCPMLRELPAGIFVVHGNARLVGLPIEALPDHMRIVGNLTIESCPRLTSLPSGLGVGGKLTLRNCPLREFPVRLEIGGDLVIEACQQLKVIPAVLNIPGSLRINRCQGLTTIEPGLKVGESLNLTHCSSLHELPDGLEVPRRLNLSGCRQLEMLGLETKVGLGSRAPSYDRAMLVLADCQALEWLPIDLAVRGPIDIAGSGITDLPESMAAKFQLMWRGRAVRSEVVFHPERLSVSDVLDERNAELRRLMMERIGIETFLAKAQMRMLDESADAGGKRALIEIVVSQRLRRYLWCRCPSTGRQYLLRVANHLTTAQAAAAWLAGFDDPDRYRPLVET